MAAQEFAHQSPHCKAFLTCPADTAVREVPAPENSGVKGGDELGVDDYIVKPFSIREVVGRISTLLATMKGDNKIQ